MTSAREQLAEAINACLFSGSISADQVAEITEDVSYYSLAYGFGPEYYPQANGAVHLWRGVKTSTGRLVGDVYLAAVNGARGVFLVPPPR